MGKRNQKRKIRFARVKRNLMEMEGGGGGRKKDGNEKRKELTLEDIEKKVKKIDVILKKEKEEFEKSRVQKETETMRKESEEEKRKKRLKQKRTLESKWEMTRWVYRYLDENEDELSY